MGCEDTWLNHVNEKTYGERQLDKTRRRWKDITQKHLIENDCVWTQFVPHNTLLIGQFI
jgi:hypothetical protein